MGGKNTSKRDGFDEEMRARLVFYNQLAAGSVQTDRLRRRRDNQQTYRIPKDIADKFIERVGLAQADEPTQIPITHVEHEHLFVPRVEEQPESVMMNARRLVTSTAGAAASGSAKLGRAVASGLRRPFHAGERSIVPVAAPGSHYVVGAGTKSGRRVRTMRYGVMVLAAVVLLVGAGLASFVYFHEKAIAHQRQAEQAQYEQQRQAWNCALAHYQRQTGHQTGGTPCK